MWPEYRIRKFVWRLRQLYKAKAKRRKEGQVMTLEEVKQAIEQHAGVPAALLTGETAEENIAQAKALLAYRREQTPKRPRSPEEQFAEWLNQVQGIEAQDEAGMALARIEAQAKAEAGGFPSVADSTVTADRMPDPRSPEEQFAEWLGQRTAYNPFAQTDGWKPLA